METLAQTDIIQVDAASDEPRVLVDINPVPEPAFEYPPLTQDEETFALAIIETSGNVAAAYKMPFGTDSYMPLAKGKELLCKPAIALKIRAITDAVQEASLISVGAHLDQLATIRDLSIVTGQITNRGQLVQERAD